MTAEGLRPGRLRVVGLGPGDASWITPEVADALRRATDVVGYSAYLDRIDPRPGLNFHRSDNRVEIERARLALEIAADGGDVVVASGGDPGVFAMAAAIFEAIETGNREWLALDIAVLPGISAMQAAAARIGAPLGHDFCVLSLSDNLKQWDLIAARLAASADVDLVIALYNPASISRPERIFQAFDILRESKHSQTPVVVARAVGRPDERIVVTTLGSVDPGTIDMSTIVIVGSSETRLIPREDGGAPWCYTPRWSRRLG
ncbi:MAG: precorrin-3B C(17)-methyltransferase [Leifsonia xyli]|nr:MAG: precorrin-3B C(17)-methyltransferase [Leifsonia xyli]